MEEQQVMNLWDNFVPRLYTTFFRVRGLQGEFYKPKELPPGARDVWGEGKIEIKRCIDNKIINTGYLQDNFNSIKVRVHFTFDDKGVSDVKFDIEPHGDNEYLYRAGGVVAILKLEGLPIWESR